MVLPKDILQLLKTDYTDGNWDTEDVYIPPEVALAIVNAKDKNEATRLYNECVSVGMTARDEDNQLQEWAREQSKKYGKKGGRPPANYSKAIKKAKEMHEKNPHLLAPDISDILLRTEDGKKKKEKLFSKFKKKPSLDHLTRTLRKHL